MTWRSRAGDVYWRDEFADFQEYHNLASTAHDLAAPFRPLPPDALPAVCRTLAASSSTELEQAPCTPPQKLARLARQTFDRLELQVLATWALHAQSAREMVTYRRSAPPDQRAIGSTGSLVDGHRGRA